MIEELVSRVFALRNAAHLAHWATQSYSQHVALNELYDGAIEKIDGIVEAYQGLEDMLKKVKALEYAPDDIMEKLGDDAMWVAENRKEIAKGNSAIENLLDDLVDLYAKTYYKLTRLK